MAETAARLAVVLDARIQQFEQKVARAERRMQRSSRKMTKDAKGIEAVFARLPRVIAPIGGAIAAAFSVRAMDRALSRLDAIGNTADKLGLTTTALQELQSAAQQSGVSVGTLEMAMQRFGRRLAEARQGTGAAKGVLEEMGIALVDSAGKARPLEEVL